MFILDIWYFRALFYFKLAPTLSTKTASKNQKITISHTLTPKAKIFHLGYKYIFFYFRPLNIMCKHFNAFLIFSFSFFPSIELTKFCPITFSSCHFVIPQNWGIKKRNYRMKKRKKRKMENWRRRGGRESGSYYFFLLCLVTGEQGEQRFGIFNLNEKYKTLMKSGFDGRPFSNCFPQL